MNKRIVSVIAGVFMLGATQVSAGPLEYIFNPPDANGILPIERILDQARASVAGTILEVELEREHGRLVYEVVILTSDNRKVEIEYDAKTGAELAREIKRNKKED
jgi:uncharacterized membrane protein YkoI